VAAAALIGGLLFAGAAAAQASAPGRPAPQVNAQPENPQPSDREQPAYPPPEQEQQPPPYQPPSEQPEQAEPQPADPPPLPADQPPTRNPPPCERPCPPLPTCQNAPLRSPRAGHHGLLLTGYLGVNVFQGDSEINALFGIIVRPSLRAGAMAGFYVHPQLSLNAELTIDVVRIELNNSGSDLASPGKRGTLAFSPLVHIPTVDDLELVVGPKLGLWMMSFDTHTSATWNMRGYLLGINVGAYLDMGAVSVGGLLSYESATSTRICDGSQSGICDDPELLSRSTDKVWSVVGSVLY